MTDTSGKIIYANGAITVAGSPPYALPPQITPEFIVSLLSAPPTDPNFIAVLAQHFTADDRNRLYLAARAIGGTPFTIYRKSALSWRWLLNNDGTWHPDNYQFVYRADIGSTYECQYIDHIGITSRGLRLVQTPMGWRSFPEFDYTYGETVLQHLEKAAEAVKARTAAKLQILDRIMTCVTAEVVVKTLGVYTEGKGLEQKRVAGLASVPVEEWALPKDMSYAYDDGLP